jgi:hypothetical protein
MIKEEYDDASEIVDAFNELIYSSINPMAAIFKVNQPQKR